MGIELAKKGNMEIENRITQTSIGIYFLSISVGPLLYKNHIFFLSLQLSREIKEG